MGWRKEKRKSRDEESEREGKKESRKRERDWSMGMGIVDGEGQLNEIKSEKEMKEGWTGLIAHYLRYDGSRLQETT